jgi:hypothetical protein
MGTLEEQLSLFDNQRVKSSLARIREAGIAGAVDYERKLRSNIGNHERLADLLCEGREALMFRRYGGHVKLRERLDLEITFDGQLVYVEVKAFHEKEQDRLDKTAIAESTDLFKRVADLTATEGIALTIARSRRSSVVRTDSESKTSPFAN